MNEIIHDGLRFPVDSDGYEVIAELGKELTRLNQEVLDALAVRQLSYSSSDTLARKIASANS